MFSLKSYRITPKILSVVILLNIAMIAVGLVGILALRVVAVDAEYAAQASDQAVASARLNQLILSINRAELLAAAEPREDLIKTVSEDYRQDVARIAGYLNTIRSSTSPEVQALLRQAEPAVARLVASSEKTMALASQVRGTATPEQDRQLADLALGSGEHATAARAIVTEQTTTLISRANDLEDDIQKVAQSKEILLYIVMASATIVGLGLGILIGQTGIAKPIRMINETLGELARGNYDVKIVGEDRKDEVGDIAKAAEVFRASGLEAIQMRAEQEQAKVLAAERQKAALNQMADDFENAVGEIVNIVSSAATELQAAAGTLTASAEETSSQSASVAAAAEQAAMNVQTVASAVEELASSAGEIGRQADQSRQVAGRAVSEATRTTDRMNDLRTNADQIGAIISLIDEIAEKTNLLALNATIEAARAGEAGRGFAVVANEVKGLAEQTARATAEISTQIKSMQSSTLEASEAISGIGRTIEDMSNISAAIFAAVGEQGNTTTEVARNVQQASQGAGEVTSNIVGVTQAAQEASSASSQVLSSASELARQSELLRGRVAEFLRTVRAA
ncbi:methyl-accepting chemotaxis protein [Stappia sp. TSB10GB4]|uniref:methyl-accepting chemotaxis protein n=1 Tax=Stappia sp. TSB10GB4 TaxID=2003584 RepID=UPI00164480BD|nr:methyl-accepting chemotaxis protein [Stappia sp. TSB10GB4]